MPEATVGSVRIRYERHGTSGEPVVFVHGSWVDRHSWEPILAPLAQSLELLVYDRRGHGESTGPLRSHPVRDDAADLEGLLAAVDLHPVHVVAHSYAGAVALRLAVDRPEMVRSLALHEPPFVGLLRHDPAGAAEAERIMSEADAWRARVRSGDPEGAARGVVDAFSRHPGAWERLPSSVRATFLRHAERWCEELGDPEAIEPDPALLREILIPVLLTSGELSPPFAARINRRLAESLRNADVRTLPEVGHIPHVTAPARYVGLLLTFLLERNVPVT